MRSLFFLFHTCDARTVRASTVWFSSMPAIVGADGVESDIPIELNGEEALKLKESADALKSILDGLEL